MTQQRRVFQTSDGRQAALSWPRLFCSARMLTFHTCRGCWSRLCGRRQVRAYTPLRIRHPGPPSSAMHTGSFDAPKRGPLQTRGQTHGTPAHGHLRTPLWPAVRPPPNDRAVYDPPKSACRPPPPSLPPRRPPLPRVIHVAISRPGLGSFADRALPFSVLCPPSPLRRPSVARLFLHALPLHAPPFHAHVLLVHFPHLLSPLRTGNASAEHWSSRRIPEGPVREGGPMRKGTRKSAFERENRSEIHARASSH